MSFRATFSMRSLLLLSVLVVSTISTRVLQPSIPDHALAKRQAAPAPLLVDFQVYEPVLTPSGSSDQNGCVYTKTLMVHDFAFSYGDPFVGNYTPPPCDFNRVTINFTVTSRGRQFDRLGLMYLGDNEVFRTSTAEPTANGIIWTYTKEMQQFNALWKTDQKIIFDLGNLIDNTYTGIYNTTLTATFFTVPDSPPTADTILPISSRNSANNMGSVFQIPGDDASVAYTLPNNVERAVVSLEACGQSNEEFWYTNVFNSETQTFAPTAGSYLGFGPFREVQLLIDGQLAGVSWPFPIIFTGGIVPGFWRPIVGIDAFDLREHEIDITPFLGLLLDGNPHNFSLNVAGIADDGAGNGAIGPAGSYWLVTGKIFLFLNADANAVTTGTTPTFSLPPPTVSISSLVTKSATNSSLNETLSYSTNVQRSISISSTINGKPASWTQTLTYSNFNNISAEGFTQFTSQNTSGSDSSSSTYANTYSYPIQVLSSFSTDAAGDVGINGSLTRGLDFNVYGPSVFPSGIEVFNQTNTPSIFNLPGQMQPASISIPKAKIPFLSGALLSTTQTASAEYFSSPTNPNSSYSFGTTEQDFSFQGSQSGPGDGVTLELYTRHVKAVNSTVVEDTQSLAGQTFEVPTAAPGAGVRGTEVTPFNAKTLLGKGRGTSVGGPVAKRVKRTERVRKSL